MPAKRLDSSPSPVKKFDILATSDLSKDGLFLHAALSTSEGEATNKCEIRYFHMGPPLFPWRGEFDAIGSCELSTKQNGTIREFVNRQWADQKAEKKRLEELGLWDKNAQYRILPPYSRPRKGSPLWRYSCVGFVLLAYKKAKVDLLVGPCPLKAVADLKDLYPSQFHDALDDETLRKNFGLSDGDKWPVVLVGYLLHAMDRSSDQINGENATPYQPQEGDEFFPRQSS